MIAWTIRKPGFPVLSHHLLFITSSPVLSTWSEEVNHARKAEHRVVDIEADNLTINHSDFGVSEKLTQPHFSRLCITWEILTFILLRLTQFSFSCSLTHSKSIRTLYPINRKGAIVYNNWKYAILKITVDKKPFLLFFFFLQLSWSNSKVVLCLLLCKIWKTNRYTFSHMLAFWFHYSDQSFLRLHLVILRILVHVKIDSHGFNSLSFFGTFPASFCIFDML